MTTVAELRPYRELFLNLTLRELRGKYKRSVIGWGWSMLNPIAQMITYSVVFGLFLEVPPPVGDPSGMHVFAFFLLCGLLPWAFLANGITTGMGSLLANEGLVKKVWFPRQILVASTIASWGFSFLIELGVFSVALIFAGNMVIPWLVPTLGIVVVQAGFVLGIALLLSVCSVYLRDLQHLVGIALQVWFYATPVVYPMSLVENALDGRQWALDLYRLNPMTRFAEAYRDTLYSMRFPPLTTVAYLVGAATISLVVGWWAFNRLDSRLAEEL